MPFKMCIGHAVNVEGVRCTRTSSRQFTNYTKIRILQIDLPKMLRGSGGVGDLYQQQAMVYDPHLAAAV